MDKAHVRMERAVLWLSTVISRDDGEELAEWNLFYRSNCSVRLCSSTDLVHYYFRSVYQGRVALVVGYGVGGES